MAAAAPGQPQLLQPASGIECPEDVKPGARSVPMAGGAAPPRTLQPLLPGWLEMKDPEGRLMYVNPATGQSSWRRPSVQPLPPGWQEMQTPDGKTMYVHLGTGTVTYERPGSQQMQQPEQLQTLQRVQSQPTPNPTPAANVTKVVVPRPTPESQPAASNPTKQQVVVKRPLARATTAPVSATGTATMKVSVDVGGVSIQALQNLPGGKQAQMVHQLSENNNVKVLSKKLASDVAQTSITAASLATRQAKTVGKMLISPKKLQRFSKKVIVQTGAASVKAGRACKVVMNEMVDTADGRGQYAPKKGPHTFVAFNASASINAVAAGKIRPQSLVAPAPPATQLPTQPMSNTVPLTEIAVGLQTALPVRMPSRKPVRKPVVSGASTSAVQTGHHSAVSSAPTSIPSDIIQAQDTGDHIHALEQHLPQSRPSIPAGSGGTHAQTQTHGEIKINCEMATSSTSPTSHLAPPTYQQAVHSQPVPPQQQAAQAHGEMTHGDSTHAPTKPNHLEINLSVGTQPAATTTQQFHAAGASSQAHNTYTHPPHESHIPHDEPYAHQLHTQLAGTQGHHVLEPSGLMQQQDLTHMNPSQSYQQNQTTIATDQAVIYDSNPGITPSVGSSQVGIDNQATYITAGSEPGPSTQSIDPNQGIVYDQVTFVDAGDVTVTEEEIVYVDEDGNVISEDMLTFVDEETGAVYTYAETDVNGVDCEVEIEAGGADMGDFEVDF